MAKAARASGKLGGVAGVLAGVHNCIYKWRANAEDKEQTQATGTRKNILVPGSYQPAVPKLDT